MTLPTVSIKSAPATAEHETHDALPAPANNQTSFMQKIWRKLVGAPKEAARTG